MRRIKVMVFERKNQKERYMCSNYHEWPSYDDEYGDVELNDVERAYMVWENDTKPANEETYKNWYEDMKNLDKAIKEKWGPDALNSLNPDLILETYDYKFIDIPVSKLEAVLDIEKHGYESEYLKEYYKNDK